MKIKGMKLKGKEDLKGLLRLEVPDISESDLERYSRSLHVILSIGRGVLFGYYSGTRERIEDYIGGIKEIYQEMRTQSPDKQPSARSMPEVIYIPGLF